ncbi:putative membrane-associated kinase regulator 2 [Prunus yedoensis var. nudiflora]|uniref:Putative membrane-associated kinase regulator 2 n=1 Tax=Prunus yedoensis var. nudiflora TaxID=2094558 RepID=A0A314ZVH3_PRUYE|nr:putative membrane-associated kinase regulator 2 [Prunus yedoensis var. nudiflora]
MEAFSLLKYWRGGGVVANPVPNSTDTASSANMRAPSTSTTTTTTILTAVAQHRDETDDDDSDGDDGPFFDLEFAVPDEDEAQPQTHKPSGHNTDETYVEHQEDDDDDSSEEDDEEFDDGVDGEREFNFTVSSGSSHDRTDDTTLTLSPSDDLFFKGKLVPIEPSSIELNPSEELNSKPQFAVSLLKSATKFRVFMLGLKKSKSNANGLEKTEPAVGSVEPPQKTQEKQQQQQQQPQQRKQKQQGKLSRDNSSRISTTNKSQSQTQTQTLTQQKPISSAEESASEEKRFSKEVMQKYLKMVKPLYVRVSKRYGEKLRLSGQLSLSGSTAPAPGAGSEKSQSGTEASEPPATASIAKSYHKQGNFPAGLRVVCKHLGKSRSASSAVAAAPSGAVVSQRRDDSLLQQQDGIQSAILHCKRSFNASRDSDSTLLSRSVSDPSNEKSVESSRKSSDHGKGVGL